MVVSFSLTFRSGTGHSHDFAGMSAGDFAVDRTLSTVVVDDEAVVAVAIGYLAERIGGVEVLAQRLACGRTAREAK